eukprot:scaffold57171_cov18-Tisochrysis_lutea.AAC.1
MLRHGGSNGDPALDCDRKQPGFLRCAHTPVPNCACVEEEPPNYCVPCSLCRCGVRGPAASPPKTAASPR